MRRNVGTVDAMIRITAGLVGLAYGVGKMSRRPHRTPWLLMTMSAMKVAEGATRFCPMLYAMDTDTVTKKGMNKVIGKMTEAGVRAAMRQMTGAKGASQETKDTKENMTSEISAAITAGMSPEKVTASTSRELSKEDQQLEAVLRDYVSYSSDDQDTEDQHDLEKKPSERYSRDEHLYPTYS
ncbi:YgaP family membrane protein [Brevibacillus borstelensis]|uniref:YgaP family membrane protein n=1 Tax=Brevibacillus borstelensis TaxID=45462 RepID=UPI0030C4AC4A